MNKRFNQSIDTLESKIERLVSNYNTLRDSNRLLQVALKQKEGQNDDLISQIKELKHQNTLLKNANALLGSDEYKRETKLKINALVKEIDKCIDQLS